MSTPLATIADALIEFILSLLRDPAAVDEFERRSERDAGATTGWATRARPTCGR